MHDPWEPHLAAFKRSTRYVRADPLLGIILRVIVFSWRMIFSHGPSNGNTLSISNDDAGYKGVANAVAKIAWLRNAS
ncbi:hypothetical protein Tco_1099812 [Tanacetum coccineum]